MLKNISKLECGINDKIYQFLCDLDSPIEHVKEALLHFGNFVGQVEEENRRSQAALNPNPEPQVNNTDVPQTDVLAKNEETPINVSAQEVQ